MTNKDLDERLMPLPTVLFRSSQIVQQQERPLFKVFYHFSERLCWRVFEVSYDKPFVYNVTHFDTTCSPESFSKLLSWRCTLETFLIRTVCSDLKILLLNKALEFNVAIQLLSLDQSYYPTPHNEWERTVITTVSEFRSNYNHYNGQDVSIQGGI